MASQKLKWRKQLRHYSHKKTKAMKANELSAIEFLKKKRDYLSKIATNTLPEQDNF